MKIKYSKLLEYYDDVCILGDLPFCDGIFQLWAGNLCVKLDDIFNDLRYEYDSIVKTLKLKDINIDDMEFTGFDLFGKHGNFWELKRFIDNDIYKIIEAENIDFVIDFDAKFVEKIYDLYKKNMSNNNSYFIANVLKHIDDKTLFEVAEYLQVCREEQCCWEGENGFGHDISSLAYNIQERLEKLSKSKLFEAVAQICIKDMKNRSKL